MMNPLHYKTKEEFFGGLELLIRKICDKDELLVDKIKELILGNQHFISQSEDRRLIKWVLSPLKVEITQSRNTPRDRLLAYEILAQVKNSRSLQCTKLCHWKDLPESKWEIKQFRKALLLDPEFNTNYEFLTVDGHSHNYLGRGREGIVYLAKEKNSYQLMAIKVKCERNSKEHPYNGEEEVKAVGLFNQATGYAFKAKNYSKFNAKNYISGPNLQNLLKSHEFFDGCEKNQEIWHKLKEVLIKLTHHKLFFADIAPENFIYDGNNFYLVDLRPFRVCADQEETRRAYSYEILERIDVDSIAWTQDRWYNSDYLENKAQFVNFISEIFNNKKNYSF